jgi:hypothetical protein
MTRKTFSDLDFISNKAAWPNGVCCLLKETSSGREFGFLQASDIQLTVNLGMIWEGGTGETKTYNSVEELLSDGWLVD